MPYQNERASYEPLRRIAENERVKSLLSNYRVRHRPADPTATLTLVDVATLPSRGWKPDWVLAVDGSYLPVPIQNGYPGAEAAYITVASVMLDAAKMRKLDQQRPVEPKVFRSTQEAEALDDLLPGRNVVYEDDGSAKVSFRRALFNLLMAKRMSEHGESLLDTYEVLLQHKPKPQKQDTEQACPYEDCPVDLRYRPQNGIYQCRCSEKRTLYSVDALRIHERMNPDSGSNDRIYAEVMQVVERIWVIHILRTLEQQRWLSSLKRLAILIDGPLAVFGQPAWISQAISTELKRINGVVRTATGEDLLLLGIEKGGEFADHFDYLDQNANGVAGSFPIRTAALLTDDYIKQNIYLSDSTKPYGTGTYYGRKFFYKTRSGARIIATLPYLDDDHSDWFRADISQFPRLADAAALLDELISSRFPNSLQPIVAAHAEASIPFTLGKKVLERLARDLTAETKK
jgi:hypothetical protein